MTDLDLGAMTDLDLGACPPTAFIFMRMPNIRLTCEFTHFRFQGLESTQATNNALVLATLHPRRLSHHAYIRLRTFYYGQRAIP